MDSFVSRQLKKKPLTKRCPFCSHKFNVSSVIAEQSGSDYRGITLCPRCQNRISLNEFEVQGLPPVYCTFNPLETYYHKQ